MRENIPSRSEQWKRDEAISQNYSKAIKNALKAEAEEDMVLVLRYLYKGIREEGELSSPDDYEKLEKTSIKLTKLTDFSEEAIVKLLYGGKKEKMEQDLEEATIAQGELEGYEDF